MKFMQIKPQKARGVLTESMWTDPEWVAEEKFDGDRRIAQFDVKCAVIHYTGTRESVDGSGFVQKTANIPHLSGHGDNYPDFNRAVKLLDGTVLDGEIVAPFAKGLPGGKSKYVTAIMGSKPERALELQRKHGWLEYMVFDCLWYKGQDVRREYLRVRREYADAALREWGNKYAKLVQQLGLRGNKQAHFKNIVKCDGEGVILKNVKHTYGNEKLWVKVKGEWTADVVIMGFEQGKGKYKGQVGAIIFGQYEGSKLRRCGTCSGFDDALRGKLGKRDLDRVLRIKHNGREMTGAFRHPRFDSFREDKRAKDCIFDLAEV